MEEGLMVNEVLPSYLIGLVLLALMYGFHGRVRNDWKLASIIEGPDHLHFLSIR